MAKKSKPAPGAKTPLSPDMNMLQMFMALVDQVGDPGPETNLDRAQEIIFDAWETRDKRKRIAMAREALAISPLCADAYLILAEEAKDPQEALDLYRQAEKAGREALTDEPFEQDIGMFWGLIETRPYMRALHGLANALRGSAQDKEAVSLYREMLRLNPNDNQGARYNLMDSLLKLGRIGEAAELLKAYKSDPSGAWAWSRALLRFHDKGDAPASRKALDQAVEANPYVPTYLLDIEKLPPPPPFISLGEEDEAIAYASDAGAAWAACPGALDWLAKTRVKRASPSSEESRDARSPDEGRIDDTVLALLYLGLHDGNRAWKSFDWDAMDRLHARGLISKPAGQAKSVVFSEKGLEKAKRLYRQLFAEDARDRP
jgi:tetratricopeptide (TPR) repeat protein